MSSTWIKFLFLLTLVLLNFGVHVFTYAMLKSENYFYDLPNCSQYTNMKNCSKALKPICADDRISYYNDCHFCIEKQKKKLKYRYHGICT
ncbi:serine protease inhibitor kazal-like protein, minor form [Grammomys surdaster]|uniref:serine protease inhibitor kazal-like protein, minor form n=1 Tax=Grammomys surdaster TaxID=491861 RepID=UPI00109F34F0|nr:serine protease inhibitor kazal-like protein, minor form [Grammomys surdaster]